MKSWASLHGTEDAGGWLGGGAVSPAACSLGSYQAALEDSTDHI